MLLSELGNTIEKSRFTANGVAGIFVSNGSGGHTIQKNVSLGNDRDVVDENVNCDNNIWQKNVFQTRSATCIH